MQTIDLKEKAIEYIELRNKVIKHLPIYVDKRTSYMLDSSNKIRKNYDNFGIHTSKIISSTKDLNFALYQIERAKNES